MIFKCFGNLIFQSKKSVIWMSVQKKRGVTMKKQMMALFLMVFLLGSYLYSAEPADQNSDTVSQSMKNSGTTVGGYGAISMKFTSLDKNEGFLTEDTYFAYLIGARGGFTINKKWTIGAGFYVLTNSVPFRCGTNEHFDYDYCGVVGNKMVLGYGGGYFLYLFEIKKYFGVETGVLIGGGSFKGKNKGEYEWDDTEYSPSRSFFVLEPEILLVGKVTDYLAFGLGVSYRLVAGIDSESAYDLGDLSGVSVSLDARLGVF